MHVYILKRQRTYLDVMFVYSRYVCQNCSTHLLACLKKDLFSLFISSSLAQQPLFVKACLYPLSEMSLAFSDLLLP